MPHTTTWIICYDIAEPRRLARVHRFVSQEAIAIQYSVYLFQGNSNQLQRLLNRLETCIHSTQDDVRAYPIPRNPDIWTGGKMMTTTAAFIYDKALEPFLTPPTG